MSSTVTSKDGTTIAYEKSGSGPPVILIDGALCYRQAGPNGSLATELAGDLTVYRYDRRGRGESGDEQPYSTQREVDDLAALIDEIGEPVFLYGSSSGGVLALEAAEQLGDKVKKVSAYEIPFVVDNGHHPMPDDYVQQLENLIAANKQSAAVKHFMTAAIGFPKAAVALFPLFPGWSKNKAIAHTLIYDGLLVRDNSRGEPVPQGTWQGVTQPALMMYGGKSKAWMANTAKALSQLLPNGESEPLPGQSHIVKAKVQAPALVRFLTT